MSPDIVQTNKAIVWEFWQKLNASKADGLADLVRSYVHQHVAWHAPHPINDLHGVDAVIVDFWQPLLHAFPDLERTCQVFIGGHKHWVGTIGYFTGTFAADWLGIPATGKQVRIPFGEFSAVYDGKIGITYTIPDILALIRQAGFQLVPPSLGAEGANTGPITGDGVLLSPGDNAAGATTLRLAKDMCAAVEADQYRSFWHPDNMLWYGPSGIGALRGYHAFDVDHCVPFGHAFPEYGALFSGHHVAEIGEGMYAGWVGWPSIRTYHTGEYLGCPPTGTYAEWRLMDFYRRENNLIIENWVPVDMLHLFLTMGYDILAELRRQVANATA